VLNFWATLYSVGAYKAQRLYAWSHLVASTLIVVAAHCHYDVAACVLLRATPLIHTFVC